MTEKENPLQHRLTKAEFYDFVKDCRAKVETHLHSNIDETFLIDYFKFRGVILPPDIALYEWKHTFKNVSLMTSRDGIMKDAFIYYSVFIKKYATVIDSPFKNREHPSQGYFDMSEKEVKAILLRLVAELNLERKYVNEAAFGFHYSMLHLYWNLRTEMREKVGDSLVEINYNDTCNLADEIGKVKLQDALECNNVYANTLVTILSTLQYSDVSRRFAVYIADVGLLSTLAAHITEISYLSNLNQESVSRILDSVLQIVYNIAHHSDFKTKKQFDATKKALMNFPDVDNDFRELHIMISLVYTMDEHELCSLGDESNVVDTIIKYMQEALANKDRWYISSKFCMSLWELADGLTQLTIKNSNRSKIAHKDGALAALVNMLRHKNFKENASAVSCIHALAQDSDVRLTLLEFPDLVPAMSDLRQTTSIKLRKIIDDVLKTLRFCTPDNSVDNLASSAVARPSLMAETSKPLQDIALRDQHYSAAEHQFFDVANQLKNISQNEYQRLMPIFFTFFSSHQSTTHVKHVYQQEDLQEKFTARGKSEKLQPEDEQVIKKHWNLLIEEVDVTHIIMELISQKVFDVDDKREILGPDSRKKRTEIMLNKLLNAGPGSAFKNFIQVLQKDHSHTVDKMRK